MYENLKQIKFIFLMVTVISVFSGCSENRKNSVSGTILKDDLNSEFVFNKVPQKVISLAPNITEMIYALGQDSNLSANTLYCNYPPEARNKMKVGDLITIDFEKILSIKPDLIFITVEGNIKESYNKLKSLGMKVFVSNPRDFEGIKKTFRDLGNIFHDTLKAERIIYGWDKQYKYILYEKDKFRPVKGMFMVSTNPIMLAGKTTFINELMSSAGLQNIAADSPLNYPMYSREEILRRDPEYILITVEEDSKLLMKMYPEWKHLSAVRKNQVKVVDADLFMRPGPRFTHALVTLFTYLHPQGN